MVVTGNEVRLHVGLSRSPDVPELSVTEVRNALRCPRSFALGRARGQSVIFPIGSSSLGAMFHRIVERFASESDKTAQLGMSTAGAADREQASRVLADALLKHLIGELEATQEAAMMPGEVDDLAEALRRLASSLAPPAEWATAESVQPIREHAGCELRARLRGPGGVSALIVGRTDELVPLLEGGLGVVEFKLADEGSEELDRAQSALYRALLQRALEIDAVPALLRYNPRTLTTTLAPSEADALMERRILPLIEQMVGWSGRPDSAPPTVRRDLCPVCPVRVECADTFKEWFEPRDCALAGAARPVPDSEGKLSMPSVSKADVTTPYDMAGMEEAEEIQNRIVAEVRRQGVGITPRKAPTVGPRLISIEVHCPRHRVAQLDRVAEDVEHQLSNDEVRYERIGPRPFFTVPRKTPRQVELTTLLARKCDYLRERPGRFIVGEGMNGDVIVGDLSDGSSCHLLIGGQTGSGKSVLLRALISSMCHFHAPSAIRFTLVDPKRVTFGSFAASVATHLSGPVFYDLEAFLPALDDLVAEMETRYERMERCRAQNIDDYNASSAEKLARRVVVVDEFQDLVAVKSLRQPFIDAVKRLGAKARAAGIHLILATQRPDRSTVPGEIKANLCGRIALRVQEAVNSRIILDHGGAESLLGRGDLLADLGQGLVRGQAPIA
ncbi:FtsK/SpoIIIE domain-containing protein [Sorangium sp. So ce429]